MDYGLGGYKTIDAFVEAKLVRFEKSPHDFETMFGLMFAEAGNVMYEKSEGYRIKKTTYGEAKAAALSMAADLSGALPDLPHDSVVGLYLENSLEWIECFWAIIAAGFRPLLFNMRLSDSSLADAAKTVGCAAVISESRDLGLLRIDPASLRKDGDPESGRPFGTEIFVMSSGTTEHVKICAYSAEEFYCQIVDTFNIIKKCRMVKKHCEGSLKLLTFLPFYHVFGLIAVYIWFSFFSRTFVHLADLSPETIVNTIRRHKVTHIFAVPLFWEKVYGQAMKTIRSHGDKTLGKFERGMRIYDKLPDAAARLFSKIAFREVRDNLFGDSIRFLITGGSPVSAEVLRFFNGIGYRLANGYGMTEIGITSFETSGKKKYLLGAFVGGPMKYAKYRINEDGELLVSGRVIAKYVIEDGVKKERDGWFATRDLALCEDGHYKILGRRDDVIIARGGENLNPNLIEPLVTPPGARGVCLVGCDTPEGRTSVLLVSVGKYISKEKFSKIDEETRALIDAAGLSGQIGKIAYIAEPLLSGDEFKLNRRRLTDEYARGVFTEKRLSDTDAGGETDALTARIVSYFAAALDAEEGSVGPDSDFFLDCGGGSIDYFAMISKLREEFDVPFPTEGGKGLNTPRGIADFISRSGGA
ncbi:MAG: non-ribosomal peptide synthetase [Clostridia bacterium]|nr:non-ribosomal peptide synthetase [Clostridia bacterium]MBR7033780.1 non-ribosomal peptide synthetase [Clostridia bacterium]